MATEKKAVPLRIQKELWEELKAWADQDLRSLNSQIELLLREAVKARLGQKKNSIRKAS